MAKISIWPFLREQQAMVPGSRRSGGDQLPASTLAGPDGWLLRPSLLLPLPPLQVALAAKSEGEHASQPNTALGFQSEPAGNEVTKLSWNQTGFFITTSSNREGRFLEKGVLTLVAVYCLQSKTRTS